MNPSFKTFLDRPAQDRQDVFEGAAARLDTLPTYVEKDFWVCLTLDILYNGLPDGHPHLLFKGGTSLSKVYGLINRFSEDIDITVFRSELGFHGERDPASKELSRNKRQKLSKQLNQAASEYVLGQLKVDLGSITANLGKGCVVEADPDHPNEATLLVQYPSLFPRNPSAYIQPRVKIESGARSALDPHSQHTIAPIITGELTEQDLTVRNITTIAAERTFWDKVIILHSTQCGYRYGDRLPRDRNLLSRHYYDVAAIAETETGKNAAKDRALMEDVREYTLIMFGSGWMRLEEAKPGSFQLVCTDMLRKALKADYEATKGMIYGEPPTFDEIIEVIERLQSRLNT